MFIVFWEQKSKKNIDSPKQTVTFAHANKTSHVQNARKYYHLWLASSRRHEVLPVIQEILLQYVTGHSGGLAQDLINASRMIAHTTMLVVSPSGLLPSPRFGGKLSVGPRFLILGKFCVMLRAIFSTQPGPRMAGLAWLRLLVGSPRLVMTESSYGRISKMPSTRLRATRSCFGGPQINSWNGPKMGISGGPN